VKGNVTQCELFKVGASVSDADRRAAIHHDLHVNNQQMRSMGVTEEFADKYLEECGGKCVHHNSLLCNRHDTSPPPLPNGLMDERIFYSQLSTFDEKIELQTRVVDECRVRWMSMSKQRQAMGVLKSVSTEIQVGMSVWFGCLFWLLVLVACFGI